MHAFHQRIWLVALVVHVVTAWFSSGFYAADEHYQIIAFAQAKLGELPIADLPWEHEVGIRSALLPSLAFAVINTSRALITSDPFCIAFMLRLITALFALFVVRSLVSAAMHMVSPALIRPYVLLSYFLWFLPYQHVRFATETWAGLLFLFGLAQVISEKHVSYRWLLAGACFGLAIHVKPAMGIPCMSVFILAFVSKKVTWPIAVRSTIGIMVAFVIGALVDSWFYGGYIPTTWNFVRTAVAGDPQHMFEVYPWYYYFPWIIKYGIGPIGILLIAALAWLTFRQPRAILVWCMWPYLIILSVVPHKELRFLFPLVDLAPLLLVLAWQEFVAFQSVGILQRTSIRSASVLSLAVLLVVNLMGLVLAGTSAAGSGRTRLAEALAAVRTTNDLTLGYALSGEGIWAVRIPKFYLDPAVRDAGTTDPCASDPQVEFALPTFLIGSEADPAASGCTLGSQGYRVIARTEPKWMRTIWHMYNSERPQAFLLYQRDPSPSRPSEL